MVILSPKAAVPNPDTCRGRIQWLVSHPRADYPLRYTQAASDRDLSKREKKLSDKHTKREENNKQLSGIPMNISTPSGLLISSRINCPSVRSRAKKMHMHMRRRSRRKKTPNQKTKSSTTHEDEERGKERKNRCHGSSEKEKLRCGSTRCSRIAGTNP